MGPTGPMGPWAQKKMENMGPMAPWAQKKKSSEDSRSFRRLRVLPRTPGPSADLLKNLDSSKASMLTGCLPLEIHESRTKHIGPTGPWTQKKLEIMGPMGPMAPMGPMGPMGP